LDAERVEIFLSGSSARLLSREVATQMRGRAMEALVLPFSFRECLRHAGAEPAVPAPRLTKAARSAVHKRLRDYLAAGGFPEAQGLTLRDRLELLRGYVDTALFRDVVERHAVSNPVALRWMVRRLLGNAAGMFSVQRFYADLRSQGISVAKDTLHAYLGHLEDAFLIRTLPIAGGSERRRMVNPRKVYPVDPGLIPVFDRAGRANEGHALETVVALELERRGAEVAYVRTPEGFEVDFLARHREGGEQLIQVCADLDAPGTRERETRSLLAAARDHPRATLHVVALAGESTPPLPGQIRLHRATDWLLQT
jgi:predicted AAA+ superfamily ATPase